MRIKKGMAFLTLAVLILNGSQFIFSGSRVPKSIVLFNRLTPRATNSCHLTQFICQSNLLQPGLIIDNRSLDKALIEPSTFDVTISCPTIVNRQFRIQAAESCLTKTMLNGRIAYGGTIPGTLSSITTGHTFPVNIDLVTYDGNEYVFTVPIPAYGPDDFLRYTTGPLHIYARLSLLSTPGSRTTYSCGGSAPAPTDPALPATPQ